MPNPEDNPEDRPVAPVDELVPVAPETESAPEDDCPMLDVHPSHHPIQTWREFFVHIATISVGLLIAVGLEQGVELVHRHHELRVLQEDLREETLTNRDWGGFNLAYIDRDMDWLLELRARLNLLQTGGDKNAFVYPAPPAGYPGDPNHTDRRLQAATVWNTARQNSQVDLLPSEDAHMYTTFYRVSDLYSDNFTTLTLDWRKLTAFEFKFADTRTPGQPDVRRMSAQELDEYEGIVADLYMEARSVRRYLQIQMAYNEAAVNHRTLPDIETYLQTRAGGPETDPAGSAGR